MGVVVACEARHGCHAPARVRVFVSGTKASEFDPTDTCRGHVSVVVMAALAVSNDVRVRRV